MVQNNGAAIQMTDIHDIKPIERIGFDPVIFHYILYTLLGIIILALLVLFFLYLKKRKRKKVEVDVPMPPDEAALRAIDVLASKIDTDGRAFYFDLSAILRGYIQGRFDIDSLEMTTEELLPEIDRLDVERNLKADIKKFIMSSDPVKFAGYPAAREKMENDILFVKNFVKQTTPLMKNKR